ncbi:MAG: putative multiple sugar transport system substrate-binding protein, partial [Chloroflexi bacterium]
MSKKRTLYILLAVMFVFAAVVSACKPKPIEEGTKLAVGIVLPTKDEPRWIQDEARFRDALSAAGYDVEILFSQGDSAKEKANVEALITKGIKVLIICPQDGTAAAAAAEAAREAGVKVISYDRLIRDTAAVD